ncbi:hypothetical protein MRX96_038306 [Rhipicephalus microplus]
MAFSPDCTKVASTHGDHRIHVCEVATGKLAHTLEGHPRTPWCLAFHPSSNHILASGCLAGQVRVWDLRGGSEVWHSPEGTVISSLAFHPLESLLAIATANRVVLWDWRKGLALATCKTASEREKVRFVQFCAPRGDLLVTGITNVDPGAPGTSGPPLLDPVLGDASAGAACARCGGRHWGESGAQHQRSACVLVRTLRSVASAVGTPAAGVAFTGARGGATAGTQLCSRSHQLL